MCRQAYSSFESSFFGFNKKKIHHKLLLMWHVPTLDMPSFGYSLKEQALRGNCVTKWLTWHLMSVKGVAKLKVPGRQTNRGEVKLTRSLTLVSSKRVSWVKYECQVLRLYLLKIKAKVNVRNRQTNRWKVNVTRLLGQGSWWQLKRLHGLSMHTKY